MLRMRRELFCRLLKGHFRLSYSGALIDLTYFQIHLCIQIILSVVVQQCGFGKIFIQQISNPLDYNKKMGNSTQKKKAHASFLHAYDIIQTNQQANLKFLQHKTTHQQYLLKQLTFNNIKECHKAMDKLSELKGKLNGSRNVVQLKEFIMSSDEQYCGTFYKVYALFQYPMRTLDDEIGERKVQKKSFSQTQLWSILASCVAGLSHLQKNGIRHQTLKSRNIILSHEGIIKISDPYILNLPSNYQSMLTKLNTRHIYPSPQQIASLQQQLISPSYNTHKNDVFTLGMIMLEAALLEYQDEQCYSNDRHRIRWDSVQYNIDRVGKCYSQQIKNMLGFMLAKEEGMRPDWIFLEHNCMDNGNGNKKSVVSVGSQKQRSNASQKIIINSNVGKNMAFHSTQQINSLESLQNMNPHFIKIDTSRAMVPEQIPPGPPIFQHSAYKLPKANFTFGTPNSFPNPQIYISPAKVVTGFQSTPGSMQNTQYIEQVPQTQSFSSRSIMQIPLPSRQSIPRQSIQFPQQIVQSGEIRSTITIPPLRPSIIETTRPLRNMFPPDSYLCRTKIDDNIVRNKSHEKFLITEKSNITALPEINNNFTSPIHTQYRTVERSQPQMTSFSTPVSIQITQKMKDNGQLFRGFADEIHETERDRDSADELEYVQENYELGSRYQGHKLNGLRHGEGKFYYQDGGMYDGEWKQNKMHGYGKLYYQSDKLAYEGQWINDQFSGKGTIYNEDPEPLSREFNYRNFDDLDQYWTKYQGQFINDSKYGRGVLYISNGQKFDGYFKADYIQGPGTFYSKDGTPITGIWSQNRKVA